MDSIGKFFKGLRENERISIDQLAEFTKIRNNIIKDIEADNLKELFESGHLKIFIQTLGKYFNASQSDINEAILLIDKKYKLNNLPKVHVIEHKAESKLVISSNTIYSLFLVIFLLAITVVIIYFYNEGELTYERVKRDLFAERKTVTHVIKEDTDVDKDSVWVKQQQLLDSKRSVNDKRKSLIDNVKVIYDTTDYVSDIIFNNEYNALNPKL